MKTSRETDDGDVAKGIYKAFNEKALLSAEYYRVYQYNSYTESIHGLSK